MGSSLLNQRRSQKWVRLSQKLRNYQIFNQHLLLDFLKDKDAWTSVLFLKNNFKPKLECVFGFGNGYTAKMQPAYEVLGKDLAAYLLVKWSIKETNRNFHRFRGRFAGCSSGTFLTISLGSIGSGNLPQEVQARSSGKGYFIPERANPESCFQKKASFRAGRREIRCRSGGDGSAADRSGLQQVADISHELHLRHLGSVQ